MQVTYENGIIEIKTGSWKLTSVFIDIASGLALNTTASTATVVRIKATSKQAEKFVAKAQAFIAQQKQLHAA